MLTRSSRSGAAKTTLYWHFQSKDQLVAAYLRRRSDQWRAFLEETLGQHTGAPPEQIDTIFGLLAEGCAHPQFRGCPFINAVAEFPDPTHPARIVISEHRAWLHGIFVGIAIDGGAASPEPLATWFCMLYDSALVTTQLNT